MSNGQTYIPELFKDTIFHIPLYQRTFSWEEEQLKDLFDDIKNQKEQKDYYFGTILLQSKGKLENYNVKEIVDGQQRITSLIILVSTILIKMKEAGKNISEIEKLYIRDENFFKIKIFSEDDDLFRNTILGNEKISESVLDTPSKKRLVGAKDYLLKRVSNLSGEELGSFFKKIEKTKVLVYTVEDDSEAALIFETTNDRGKSLTNLEKIKSFLMYKTYLSTNSPTNDLSDIHHRFSKIYRDCETLSEYYYDEDDILYYHYIAFEQWESKEEFLYDAFMDTFKERLNKLVNKKDNEEKALKYIKKFSKELQESYANIKEMYGVQHYDHLADLDLLGRMAKFIPLLLKVYKYDESNKKERFAKIVRGLEIFDFKVFGLLRKPKNTAELAFQIMARDFSGDFDTLIEEIKENIDKYASDKDLKVALMADDFYDRIQNSDQKYLLWKYENYLRENFQPVMPVLGIKEFKSDDARKSLTIEHIIPQSDGGVLKVLASRKVVPEYDDELEQKYINCLGNLTIDPKSANSSKGNKNFDEKNQEYFRQSIFKTQHELNEFINSETNIFDIESIDKRRQKIIKFVFSYWNKKNV